MVSNNLCRPFNFHEFFYSEPGWTDFELRVPEARRQLVRRRGAVVEPVGFLAKNLGIPNRPRPEHVPKKSQGI